MDSSNLGVSDSVGGQGPVVAQPVGQDPVSQPAPTPITMPTLGDPSLAQPSSSVPEASAFPVTPVATPTITDNQVQPDAVPAPTPAPTPEPITESSQPPVAPTEDQPSTSAPVAPEEQEEMTLPPPPGVKKKTPMVVWIILIVVILGAGVAFALFTDAGKNLLGLGSSDQDSSLLQPVDSTSITGSPSITEPSNTSTSPTGASATVTTRDAKRKNDLTTVQKYLSSYYAKNNGYPISPEPIKVDETISLIFTSLVPSFATSLPSDPNKIQGWAYKYKSADGSSYELTARLEDTTDKTGAMVENIFTYLVTKSSTEEVATTPSTPAPPATPEAPTVNTTSNTSLPTSIDDTGNGQDFTFGSGS